MLPFIHLIFINYLLYIQHIVFDDFERLVKLFCKLIICFALVFFFPPFICNLSEDITGTLNWILLSDHNAHRVIYLKIWCLDVDHIMLNVRFVEEHFPFV